MSFLNRFRKLGWKLTLSYTFVSSLLFIVVMLCIFAGFTYFVVINDTIAFELMEGLYEATAEEARFILELDPEDREDAAVEWIDSKFTVNRVVLTNENNTVSTAIENVAFYAMFDASGDLLALDPDLPTTNDQLEDAEVQGYLSEILAVQSERTNLHYLSNENGAVYTKLNSETDDDDFIVIMLLLESTALVPNQVPQGEIFTAYTSAILTGTLAITFVATIVGAASGWFASRGLVKRLKVLSDSADSWAKGNFDVVVRDKSEDEIGQLGRQLNAMASELETLVGTRSELATIEERNRLARDLHDAAKQQIFATSMQIGAAKALFETHPDQAKQHLHEAEQLAKQVQKELSGLIQELRPAQLEDKGLAEAVRLSAENWTRQNNISVDVRVTGEREIPLTIEQTLFRISQESLNNIAKHSQATHVNIHIDIDDQQIELKVSDNGVGFDPANSNGGLGLRSMRERMERIGGKFVIKSLNSAETGTTIKASCPL